MKRLAIFIIASALIAGVFTYQNWRGKKLAQSKNQSALLAEPVHTYSSIPVTTEEPECSNYKEMRTFEKPVPVVWTAKLDGCLVSCLGASFTRVPEDKKYPRFAGYYPNDESIPGELLKNGLILKIYGRWTGIDADHPRTVFENKCVPMVDIEKIEITK